jgi:hypothetical protein
MEQFTWVNGRAIRSADMECKSGQMEHGTKECGEKIKLAAKENSGMSTVMSLKENGSTTKRMAMVYILTQMELAIWANGKTTYNMERAEKLGLTGLSTMGITAAARNMDLESIGGPTGPFMKDTGLIIGLKVRELTFGQMDVATKEAG